MTGALRYAGQALVHALVAAVIGVFATWPRLAALPADAAQVKLSFVHGAKRTEDCRRLTSEEIARLPPSQRRPNTCGRERIVMRVQIELDGRIIYDADLPPTGLARDGPARLYEKFRVPAGRHEIVARLRDSGRPQGFDYESRATLELAPAQSVVIDFKAEQGAFVFH